MATEQRTLCPGKIALSAEQIPVKSKSQDQPCAEPEHKNQQKYHDSADEYRCEQDICRQVKVQSVDKEQSDGNTQD